MGGNNCLSLKFLKILANVCLMVNNKLKTYKKVSVYAFVAQVPQNFRYVVEQTLKEFFKAIQSGKDTEQSWKKSIYKIISRLDDPVPEYFKSPNFLEQLE